MLMQVFIMGVYVYYFENRTHYFIIMNPIIIVMIASLLTVVVRLLQLSPNILNSNLNK